MEFRWRNIKLWNSSTVLHEDDSPHYTRLVANFLPRYKSIALYEDLLYIDFSASPKGAERHVCVTAEPYIPVVPCREARSRKRSGVQCTAAVADCTIMQRDRYLRITISTRSASITFAHRHVYVCVFCVCMSVSFKSCVRVVHLWFLLDRPHSSLFLFFLSFSLIRISRTLALSSSHSFAWFCCETTETHYPLASICEATKSWTVGFRWNLQSVRERSSDGTVHVIVCEIFEGVGSCIDIS